MAAELESEFQQYYHTLEQPCQQHMMVPTMKPDDLSTSPLPELNELTYPSTDSTTDTTACLLQSSSQPELTQPGFSSSFSQLSMVDTRRLLLRAKAALLRLSQSVAATSPDGELTENHRCVLASTLASIETCLNDHEQQISDIDIDECCLLVRRALRLINDFDGGESDGESTLLDENSLQSEDEFASTEGDLVTWTPAATAASRTASRATSCCSSTSAVEDTEGSSTTSLLPSELLNQFHRCGQQWMQLMMIQKQQQQAAGTTGGNRGSRPTGLIKAATSGDPATLLRAAPAQSAGDAFLRPRRHLIVSPTGGSVLLSHLHRGRFCFASGRKHQHQQHNKKPSQQLQQQLVLGCIRYRQPESQPQFHQNTESGRQRSELRRRPCCCRTLLPASGQLLVPPAAAASAAASEASPLQPQSGPPPRRRPAYVRVMAIVQHADTDGGGYGRIQQAESPSTLYLQDSKFACHERGLAA